MSRSLIGVLVVCCLFSSPSKAQELVVPEDAKFVVQLDIGAFRSTELGSRILRLTEKMAQEELGSQEADVLAKVEESLGFNPLEEIHSLTIVGTDFEDPEEDLRVMLRMGETTGNLEGLMLALPGYSSEEHGKHTIHSAHEGDNQVYASIHTARRGNKSVVAATSREAVEQMLEVLDSKGSRAGRVIAGKVPDGTFAQVKILQLPDEVLEHGSSANIAKMLQDISITLSEQGEDFAVDVHITTSDEKRAEQIQQLSQGLKALVGLFEGEIGDDEEAKMALELLEKIVVERNGNSVSLHVSVPEQTIIQLIEDEAHLELDL